MMRRRLLNLRIFSFEVSPSILNYNSYKTILSTETEYGNVIGTTNITTINGKSYYTLYSGGDYGTTVATLNFVTTTANQQVSIELVASSEQNKDYVAAGLLDSDSIVNTSIKLSGTQSSTYTYTVAEPGAHYIKIFYRKDSSGSANNDRGYFRLVPFTNTVSKNGAPDSQTINITSYGGFEITDKPSWVTTSVNSGNAGNVSVLVLATLNTGQSRNGTITIKDLKNNEYHTVTVNQSASPYLIETTRDYFYESMEAGSNTFTVTLVNNTSWSILSYSTSHSWFTLSPTSGGNNTQVTIEWAANSSSSRQCDVTLRGNNGGTKTITIVQEKSICYCDCNNYDPCSCDSYGSSGACTCDCQTKSTQTTGCYCDCNNHNSCKVVYSPSGCPCLCNSVGCYECGCDSVCAYCYDETCTPCYDGGRWCNCDAENCTCQCDSVCTSYCDPECSCHGVVHCTDCEESVCNEDFPNGIKCYDDANYCIGKCDIDCPSNNPHCGDCADCLDCAEGCSPEYCNCDLDYTYCPSKSEWTCSCDSQSDSAIFCPCDSETCGCVCEGNCKGECYDETCTPCYDGDTCNCDSVGCGHCSGETSCAPYIKTGCSCHTNQLICNPHGCNDCSSQTYCTSDYVCSCDCERNCGCDGYLKIN